jgi:hydrogenase-4 membrane subunit HyfE
MNPLLIALLGALVIPLFVGTWRTSLLGLSAQGLLMAALAHRAAASLDTAHDWIRLLDLALIRGLVMPAALYAVLKGQGARARNDVIPPNLFFWTLALAVGLAAFNFAEHLVSEPGEPQTLVAVAVAGLLLGFLVLSGSSEPFGQMVGALRIENAIALLELSGNDHPALGLQLALLAIFSATLGLFCWYLATLKEPGEESAESAPDSLSL